MLECCKYILSYVNYGTLEDPSIPQGILPPILNVFSYMWGGYSTCRQNYNLVVFMRRLSTTEMIGCPPTRGEFLVVHLGCQLDGI